jgi:hypothetical protein
MRALRMHFVELPRSIAGAPLCSGVGIITRAEYAARCFLLTAALRATECA